MKFKAVQWNIGGGYIRSKLDEPISQDYSCNGIDEIITFLNKLNPDFITLQETHTNLEKHQVEIISKALNLPYYINDIYDKSHLDTGSHLGQAIISRYPIVNHEFQFFINPKYETIGPDGSKWISHNKGITSATIQLPNSKTLQVQVLHLVPFRKFGVDPLDLSTEKLREDITKKINVDSMFLLQGDFNFNHESIEVFLPKIFSDKNTNEIKIDSPTTPRGRRYDHVVYRGIKLLEHSIVDQVLTDHYPIVSDFEI